MSGIDIVFVLFAVFLLIPAGLALWACAIIVSLDAWRRITGKESNPSDQRADQEISHGK